MHCTVGKKGANWACKLVATQSGLLTFSIKRSNSKSVFGAFGSEKKRKRLVWRPAFERPLASRKADAKKRSSESFKARKSWMSVVEHRPSRTHITQSWKNLTEKFRNFWTTTKVPFTPVQFQHWFKVIQAGVGTQYYAPATPPNSWRRGQLRHQTVGDQRCLFCATGPAGGGSGGWACAPTLRRRTPGCACAGGTKRDGLLSSTGKKPDYFQTCLKNFLEGCRGT